MTRLCEHCGSPLPDTKARGNERRFCSARCRVAHRRLIVTGTPAPVNRNTAPQPATPTPSSPPQGNQTTYDTYKASLLPEGSYRSFEAEASIKLDANGYPELPAFLDRRALVLPTLATEEAA